MLSSHKSLQPKTFHISLRRNLEYWINYSFFIIVDHLYSHNVNISYMISQLLKMEDFESGYYFWLSLFLVQFVILANFRETTSESEYLKITTYF